MKLCCSLLLALPLLASAKRGKRPNPKSNEDSYYGKKEKKERDDSSSFDPPVWKSFDALATEVDAGYFGDYENYDASAISSVFEGIGAVFVFDLGSSSSLYRRRGTDITLAEQRAIFQELAPIAGGNNGIVMKSVGDSLQLYYESVSDGLAGTRAMYLALVARWRAKVDAACNSSGAPDWCGDIEEERKRFYNTAAVGGGYGSMVLIGEPGRYVDAFGASVNNAYFAGEEEAEHGETIIDEDALQSLLTEAGIGPQDACDKGAVEWTADELGVNHIVVKTYPFGCYYTVCFDEECKIPDDE